MNKALAISFVKIETFLDIAIKSIYIFVVCDENLLLPLLYIACTKFG